jgi:hypothetical protein
VAYVEPPQLYPTAGAPDDDPTRRLAGALFNMERYLCEIRDSLAPTESRVVEQGTFTRGPTRVLSPALLGQPVPLVPGVTMRRGIWIWHENPAATVLYIGTGPGVSSLIYSFQVAGGVFWELPGPPYYAGELWGVFSAAGGAALVTELL